MDVRKGMHFRSNINNREIEVIEATADYVTYRDLKYLTVFTLGRQTFERCDIKEIADA